MKKGMISRFLLTAALLMAASAAGAAAGEAVYDTNPPFKTDFLKAMTIAAGPSGKMIRAFNPKNPYNVLINYELGMHCVGFDVSYWCVIPPYNSIQAQVFKPGEDGGMPRLLSLDEGLSLYYSLRDNSYSQGNTMKYWQITKDVYGTGKMDEPGDSMANYVWTHLLIYKDLEGTIPQDWTEEKRLHVGKDIQVPIDCGPTGKSLAGGYLSYAGGSGGNKVFTDSMIPEVKNVPLTLTASYLWERSDCR